MFHLSLRINEDTILREGLKPFIGERSQILCESVPRIYLFPTYEDVENALSNWFGEWCEENAIFENELVLFEVSPPNTFPIADHGTGYELVSYNVIPKEYIKFHSYILN
jgi:hypothetical protein